jgi:hypothetical protein
MGRKLREKFGLATWRGPFRGSWEGAERRNVHELFKANGSSVMRKIVPSHDNVNLDIFIFKIRTSVNLDIYFFLNASRHVSVKINKKCYFN